MSIDKAKATTEFAAGGYSRFTTAFGRLTFGQEVMHTVGSRSTEKEADGGEKGVERARGRETVFGEVCCEVAEVMEGDRYIFHILSLTTFTCLHMMLGVLTFKRFALRQESV